MAHIVGKTMLPEYTDKVIVQKLLLGSHDQFIEYTIFSRLPSIAMWTYQKQTRLLEPGESVELWTTNEAGNQERTHSCLNSMTTRQA